MVFVFTSVNGVAAQLSQDAVRAFDDYVYGVEARLAKQHSSLQTFIAAPENGRDNGPGARPQLNDIYIEKVNGGTWTAPGALLHHWRAGTVVQKANASQMLALLRDFDGLPKRYAPQVAGSRVLSNNGQVATIAVRLKEEHVVTIVLDAEYRVEAKLLGNDRGYSISRSAHVWQIENPGTPQERRRPEGDDDGFLWRLNSYWSFARAGEGLRIECEAVSLTRDIPLGLGWLIAPLIADFPRDELEFTLRATRNALAASVGQE